VLIDRFSTRGHLQWRTRRSDALLVKFCKIYKIAYQPSKPSRYKKTLTLPALVKPSPRRRTRIEMT